MRLSEVASGWITRVAGMRRFSLRGLAIAKAERDVVGLALNAAHLQPPLAEFGQRPHDLTPTRARARRTAEP